MKEYTFEELGYFAERECQAIKDCLQGYSYMNFDIAWSNQADTGLGRELMVINCYMFTGFGILENRKCRHAEPP